MLRTSLLTMAMLLTAASAAALAQTQNCPRGNCPNPGQNCPRNGQCARGNGNAAKAGPAATNRGMGRRAGMGNGCGRAMNPPPTQENKK